MNAPSGLTFWTSHCEAKRDVYAVESVDQASGLMRILGKLGEFHVSPSELREPTEQELVTKINGSGDVGIEHCPICHHDHIEGGAFDLTNGEVVQECYCQRCGLEWSQYYKPSTKRLTR